MKRIHKYNDHHKVPRSRNWNRDHDNIDRLKVTTHDAIHTLFWNSTFVEKINILINMDVKVLQWDFLRDIQRVLDLYDGLEYHNHVIKQYDGNK